MSLVQDVRFALRMIRKRPAVSTVVVLTLGLGIAANGILFAIFYGSVLRPLPFEQPERLVALGRSQPGVWNLLDVSAPNFHDWMDGNEVFTGAGAYAWRNYNFQSASEPARLHGTAVTAELFPLLGVQPAFGRFYDQAESVADAALTAVISEDYSRAKQYIEELEA